MMSRLLLILSAAIFVWTVPAGAEDPRSAMLNDFNQKFTRAIVWKSLKNVESPLTKQGYQFVGVPSQIQFSQEKTWTSKDKSLLGLRNSDELKLVFSVPIKKNGTTYHAKCDGVTLDRHSNISGAMRALYHLPGPSAKVGEDRDWALFVAQCSILDASGNKVPQQSLSQSNYFFSYDKPKVSFVYNGDMGSPGLAVSGNETKFLGEMYNAEKSQTKAGSSAARAQ